MRFLRLCRKIGPGLGLLGLTLIACWGCQPQQSCSSKNSRFLRIICKEDPYSLDPRLGGDVQNQMVTAFLFEGLMRLGKEGKPQYAMAEKVELSKDHRVYTFTLREAYWSNGERVTAYDFEHAWKTLISPDFGSVYSHQFYIIKNTQAAIKREVPMSEVGIVAVDARTLVVTLEHPAPYFLEYTTNSHFFPVCKSVDEKNPKWANGLGKDFVVNGPFYPIRREPKRCLELAKNPNYWRASEISLPGVSLLIVPDERVGLLMVERDEADWAGTPFSTLPIDAMPDLLKRGKLQLAPSASIMWYEFNCKRSPYTSAKLRRALSYAVDRQAIAEHVLKAGEKPAYSVLPPSLALKSAPYFKDNDMERARQLFNEALEELGMTKEQISPIVISTTSRSKLIDQAVQQQWEKAFGVEVRLESSEWNVYLDKLDRHDFGIATLRWQSACGDPIYNLEYQKYSSNPINDTGWENPRYVEFLNRADYELHADTRKKLLQQAEELLFQEMPLMPIYYLSETYVKQERVKNVQFSPLGKGDFTRATLEPVSEQS